MNFDDKRGFSARFKVPLSPLFSNPDFLLFYLFPSSFPQTMKSFISFLVFGVIAVQCIVYNETTAITMMDYAGAAYCCGNLGHGVPTWSCQACALNPGTQNITVVNDLITEANGYVGYNVPQNRIIVAFSGTDPLDVLNWIDDIDTIKVKYPYCSKCEVHQGFYNTWKSVEDKVYAAVRELVTAYPNATVAVTGHSLGAALTVHCALGLVQDLGLVPGTQLETIHDFGRPRVGNDHFAKYFDETIPDCWRVTHHRDPVPQLPGQLFFFHHTATEVFYNQKQTEYKVCDGSGEDKHCQDQYLLDLEVSDHLNYVHFDVVENYLSCKF